MNRLIILQENLEFTRKTWNYLMAKDKKLYLSSLAVNPKEAIEKLDFVEEGDIIVMDFEIRHVDAFELLKKFRKSKKTLPYIIAISGKEKIIGKLRKYDAYFYAILEKPFQFGKIVGIIERILNETTPRTKEELVRAELRKFDMNIMTKGYNYIAEAVLLSMENEKLLKDMKHGLYKVMCEKREGVDEDNIKWTLEKTIRSIKRYTKASIMKSYFYVIEVEEITPKRFISTIAENIQEKSEKLGL